MLHGEQGQPGETAMAATKKTPKTENEATILARLLANGNKKLPPEIARYIADLKFNEKDRARMHDLLVRNQEDKLTAAEKAEMFAFARAGTILGILQSKARLALRTASKKRAAS
jgi:hypothetical protein